MANKEMKTVIGGSEGLKLNQFREQIQDSAVLKDFFPTWLYIIDPSLGEKSVFFWSLPSDSPLKKEVLLQLAKSLEKAATDNLNPQVRTLATNRFIGLCMIGYLRTGIANPQEINFPSRLTSMIDRETNPGVKAEQLYSLAAAYGHSVQVPGGVSFWETDWQTRVDNFIDEPAHASEAISLIVKLVGMQFSSDDSRIKAIRERYSLQTLQEIVMHADEKDRGMVRELAAGAVLNILRILDDHRVRDLHDRWQEDVMDCVFATQRSDTQGS